MIIRVFSPLVRKLACFETQLKIEFLWPYTKHKYCLKTFFQVMFKDQS